MTAKPIVLFDPLPRQRALIFDESQWRRLNEIAEIVGSEDTKVDDATVERVLPEVEVVIGQTALGRERLRRAKKLRAIVNVEGNFLQNVDYETCFERGVQPLVIAPAFALPVAEWALGAAIDLARGLTHGDRVFRGGHELYGLSGNRNSFLLTGADMGFVGFGNLGRALLPLLQPFRPTLRIHDPWLPDGAIRAAGAEPASLDKVLSKSRVIFVLAGVTTENAALLDRDRLMRVRRDAAIVLASRAALVDFESFVLLAECGRFRAATDVFPREPVDADDPVRRSNLLLSAHRAGGIPEAFSTIGEMVVEDVALILKGLPPARLQAARRETVGRLRSPPGRSYAKGTKR
ncbi:MAG: NAD(P)-dependent oxidoreductase [Magnetospirillum sp.]|nr:NAD(P)-dependent oxidoreductase [Magnetospirillum sp.]